MTAPTQGTQISQDPGDIKLDGGVVGPHGTTQENQEQTESELSNEK